MAMRRAADTHNTINTYRYYHLLWELAKYSQPVRQHTLMWTLDSLTW